jgi:hypothetical protein
MRSIMWVLWLGWGFVMFASVRFCLPWRSQRGAGLDVGISLQKIYENMRERLAH